MQIKGQQADIEIKEDKVIKYYHNWQNNEGKILKKLSHPLIVKCLKATTYKGRELLHLEKVKGQSLNRMSDKIQEQLWQVLEYFDLMGVKHRDLNPSNILIDEEDSIKVIDFGWASIPKLPLKHMAPQTLNENYSVDDKEAMRMIMNERL